MGRPLNQAGELSADQQALLMLRRLRARIEELERAQTEPIAIVGIGCRFPGGAATPEAYWQLLRDGVDAIGEVPPDRWDIDALYDPNPDAAGKMSSRWGGFLADIDRFDPQFFGIAPREAASLDPQQRLLLEVAWESLEHAAISPHALAGTDTGVFVGISTADYGQYQIQQGDASQTDAYFGTGNALNAAAGRVSYVLGLNGPSMSIDTACSSSLVAIHVACQSLRNGDCSLALAGGVNVILLPEITINFSRAHMMAADGRCKTFDASADGYVRGEGCGLVVLKRLSDAVSDGDRVLAIVRGSAVNQDGRSGGFTAPNELAQQALIRRALAQAGVQPAAIDYVEAHGTGTSLGDPIEMQALGAALAAGRPANAALWVGAAKTNVGHLEAAAGIAGLIKVVLALQHEQLPPHLHFSTPNPYIPWADLAVRVPTALTPWPRTERRRLAGVSSFGFTGTNAHLVIEEAPAAAPDAPRAQEFHVLCLSARTDAALRELADSYATRIARGDLSVADICFTASARRAHFNERLAIVGRTHDELVEPLRAFASSGAAPAGMFRGSVPASPPDAAFLFTGQGSQHIGMGRQLYDRHPAFRAAFDRCADILRPHLERPLVDVVYPRDGESSPLDETAYTQPALFAFEFALVELWRSWGVTPAFVMGHSVGEYVAACVAGVFSLEDALRLVAERGRLMQALPPVGAMAAIAAAPAQVLAYLSSRTGLSIAAVNADDEVVVSGEAAAVAGLVADLGAEGIQAQPLVVSHAFHSALLDPMLDTFERAAAGVAFGTAQVGIVSNLEGALAADRLLSSAEYWRRHAREPVLFADGVRALSAEGCRVFLEIGPRATLLNLARRTLGDETRVWAASMVRGRDEEEQIGEALASMYVSGVPIDWDGVHRPAQPRSVVLPTYPFQRERHWIEMPARPAAAAARVATTHPLLGARLRSALPTFESHMDLERFPFLGDHRVNGGAVVPAALYVEIALAAAADILGPGPHAIEGLSLRHPLTLDSAHRRTVQLVAVPGADNDASFQLFSSADADGSSTWHLHASGVIRLDSDVVRRGEAPQTIVARCTARMEPSDLYRALDARGIQVGPRAQTLDELWCGAGEAIARLHRPADDFPSSAFGPSLLDACMLVLGPSLPARLREDPNVFIVSGADSIRVRRAPTGDVWSHAAIRGDAASSGGALIADLRVLDDAGDVLVEFVGLRLSRTLVGAPAALWSKPESEWLYDVVWEEARADRGASPSERANAPAIAERGRRRLTSLLPADVLIEQAAVKQALHDLSTSYIVDALHQLGWQPVVDAVVDASSLGDRLGIAAKHRRLFGRLLDILVEDGVAVRGDRATCRIVRAPVAADAAAVHASIVRRFPAIAEQMRFIERCGSRLADVLRGTCDPLELLFPGGSMTEAEHIYRDSPLAKAFNTLLADAASAVADRLAAGETLRILEIGAGTGGSSSFVLPALPPGRVEYVFTDISKTFLSRAEATFRDYPFVTYRELDIEADLAAQGFAGRRFDLVIAANVLHATRDLAATFAHVKQLLAPGGLVMLLEATQPQRWIDLTFGLTEGWWRFTDAALRPAHPLLSRAQWLEFLDAHGFADAEAVPASAGVVALPEQSLLIARSRLDVASASRPSAIDWLLFADEGGVAEAFASEVRRTGDGAILVDRGSHFRSAGDRFVVAPESGDDYARLLCDVVAGGRELRIVHFWSLDERGDDPAGGADRLCGTALRLLRSVSRLDSSLAAKVWLVTCGAQPAGGPDGPVSPPQAAVWGLGRVLGLEQPERWGGLVDMDPNASAEDQARALVAITNRTTDDDQFAIRAGVQYVPRILRAQSQSDATYTFDPAGSYLITGGLGRLGLKVARWMAAQGARTIVLVGRRGLPDRSAWSTPLVSADDERRVRAVQEIERSGARVIVAAADVCDPSAMRAVIDRMDDTAPLKGVVHASTALSTAPLADLTDEQLREMLAPKVTGACVLHELTRTRALDFFVMFSSTTSLWGVSGLAHYAAANQFLDAFAHVRRQQGLPATAINWGTWDDLQLASAEDQQRIVDTGLNPMTADRALDILGRAIAGGATSRVVASVDWSRLKPVYEARRRRPFFDRVDVTRQRSVATAATVPPAAGSDLLERLRGADDAERQELLLEHVRKEVARILRLKAGRSVDPNQGLFDLGMDSLMSVELKRRLESTLGQSLPSTLTFNYPTITALTRYLDARVAGVESTLKPEPPKRRVVSAPAPASAPSQVMSEDLLAQKLADRLQRIR